MICFPNAKINLGLNVVDKRPDGYHNIETIFYPIGIEDALEIVHDKFFDFHQTGLAIDTPQEENLVMKAVRLMQVEYKIKPISTFLIKKIPFGAGLGGGSADAAFMLKMLNEMNQLELSDERLEELASQLGADCPFFIKNKPVLATGIGNIFHSISLSLKDKYICLVKPEEFVSTAEAYASITPTIPLISLSEVIKLPIAVWKDYMINDFEVSVFPNHPIIREIKESLYRHQALYAAMSGSGSSVFGIFDHPTALASYYSKHFVWEGKL